MTTHKEDGSVLTPEEKLMRKRAWSRKSYAKNKEKYVKAKAKWKAANLEEHKRRSRRSSAKWRSSHPEKALEMAVRYDAKRKGRWMKSAKQNREKALFIASVGSARLRGHGHTITIEDIVIPDTCPMYGIPLDKNAGRRAPNKPSLDRVDNDKGYVKGNVRVISWLANFHKKSLTLPQLRQIASYIESHIAQQNIVDTVAD